MTDNWLVDTLAAVADAEAERAAAGNQKDVFRTGLKNHLEELVSLPLPTTVSSVLESLKNQGYHMVDERVYPASNRNNPLSFGHKDSRSPIGTKEVTWRTVTRRVTVWPEPRLMSSSRDNHLVIAVDIIPVDQNSALCRVTANGIKVERYSPEDFDLGQIRRMVTDNITKNGLLPTHRD